MNHPSDNILSSISIVDTVQRLGVNLRNNVAPCPLHHDNTPSFRVYPQTNSWCCFGQCIKPNNGGDTADFIMQKLHCNYYQATIWAEQQFSFSSPKEVVLPKILKAKNVDHSAVKYWHNLLGSRRQYFYDRGFEDEIINRELWGWDGSRYIIPVWDNEPQNSDCIGVRRRKVDGETGFKYLGLKGHNIACMWGKYYSTHKDTILIFAGEFDAAKAVQDKLSAVSVVNGVNSVHKFPKDWPTLWFPESKRAVVVFDKKEEIAAGVVCQMWNRFKGFGSAKIFHWPPDLDCKDYCEFREQYTADMFKGLL